MGVRRASNRASTSAAAARRARFVPRAPPSPPTPWTRRRRPEAARSASSSAAPRRAVSATSASRSATRLAATSAARFRVGGPARRASAASAAFAARAFADTAPPAPPASFALREAPAFGECRDGSLGVHLGGVAFRARGGPRLRDRRASPPTRRRAFDARSDARRPRAASSAVVAAASLGDLRLDASSSAAARLRRALASARFRVRRGRVRRRRRALRRRHRLLRRTPPRRDSASASCAREGLPPRRGRARAFRSSPARWRRRVWTGVWLVFSRRRFQFEPRPRRLASSTARCFASSSSSIRACRLEAVSHLRASA